MWEIHISEMGKCYPGLSADDAVARIGLSPRSPRGGATSSPSSPITADYIDLIKACYPHPHLSWQDQRLCVSSFCCCRRVRATLDAAGSGTATYPARQPDRYVVIKPQRHNVVSRHTDNMHLVIYLFIYLYIR